MPFPLHNDLEALDFALGGLPFVDLPTKNTVDVLGLNYSYNGLPFVENPYGVPPVPTLLVVADLNVSTGIDGASVSVVATVTPANLAVVASIEQVDTTANAITTVADLLVSIGVEDVATGSNTNIQNIADLSIVATTTATGLDPIFVDGNLAVQLDDDQYMKV